MKILQQSCAVIIAVFSLSFQSQSIQAAIPMSNPWPVDQITDITTEAFAAERQSIAQRALAKLTKDERTVIWSFIADASKLRSSSKGIDAGKLAKLKEVIAEMKNNPKFGPAKWMAADGSTFDSYEEYHEHQWGTPPGGFRW